MATNLNPGADATLVGVAYRAAMANVPGDYSRTFEKAAESYEKTMEASGKMWENVGNVAAAIGGEMVANANERAAYSAKATTLNPEDAEFLISEIYGIKDAQKELGFLPGVFGSRETKMDLAKLKMDQQELFSEIDLTAASIKAGTDAVAGGLFDTKLAMADGETVNAIIKSGLKNRVTDNGNIAKLGRNEKTGELMYTLYKEDGTLSLNPNGTSDPVTMTIKEFNKSIATNVDDKGAKAVEWNTRNDQVANRGFKSKTGIYDEQMKQMDLNWIDTQIQEPVDLKRAMHMNFGYSNTSFYDDITTNQNEYSVDLYNTLLEVTGGEGGLTGGIVDGIEDVGEPGINEVELKNSENYQILTANLLGMKDPKVTKAYFKDYVTKEFEKANNYGHSNKEEEKSKVTYINNPNSLDDDDSGYDWSKTVTRSNPLKLNGVNTNIGSLNTVRASIIEGKGFPAGDNFFNPDGNGGWNKLSADRKTEIEKYPNSAAMVLEGLHTTHEGFQNLTQYKDSSSDDAYEMPAARKADINKIFKSGKTETYAVSQLNNMFGGGFTEEDMWDKWTIGYNGKTFNLKNDEDKIALTTEIENTYDPLNPNNQ